MITAIKAKTFALPIILVVVICALISLPTRATSSPNYKYTIVLDAGHGGVDGGSEGVVTNNTERELNLEYVNCLSSYFEANEFFVVKTRKNLGGLYDPLAKNKKKSDMLKRKEIIDKAKPDIILSIHMNSFPRKSARGAQVFFNEDSEPSKSLAANMQNVLKQQIPNARKVAQHGDYYMLNCSPYTSVIVECGFLSNPEEDLLLADKAYMQKICYAVYCGVVSWVGSNNYEK